MTGCALKKANFRESNLDITNQTAAFSKPLWQHSTKHSRPRKTQQRATATLLVIGCVVALVARRR